MDTVDCIELWIECEPMEAYAVTSEGKHLKMIAQIVNGIPIYLDKKAMMQRKHITKEEADIIIKKKEVSPEKLEEVLK